MRHVAWIPVGALTLCSITVIWSAMLLPPPFWLLKYGPTPGCEPTGRTWEIEGVEFVEIGRGIARIGSPRLAEARSDGSRPGDLPGRFARPLGIEWGDAVIPSNEMPVRWTEFPHGFAISRHEITIGQFEPFESDYPRSPYSPDDDCPVVNVSAEEARGFCAWLSSRSGLQIRLPTESEWEAACRAGSPYEYCYGSGVSRLSEYAWFDRPGSSGRAHPVGQLEPNAWGLFDMHGNAWELCANEGVYRGGSWRDGPEECRAARRYRAPHELWWHSCDGFRPVFTPPDR